MSYTTEFAEALIFNKKVDKELKNQNIDREALIYNIENEFKSDHDLGEFLNSILDVAAKSFISNSTIDLANQCHNVSQQFFNNWMSQELGEIAPISITIGNISFDNEEIYTVSKSSIKKTINEGFNPNKSLDLHVWLTFQNMKVLDLTIVPTLIRKGLATSEDFNGKKYVIWEEEDGSRLAYKPILQNNHFLYLVDRVKGYA